MPTKVVFIHLLLTANWKQGTFLGVTVDPGSTVTSHGKIAEETGLTAKQVRRALDNLRKTGEITVSRAGSGQLVTVANWAMYQFDDESRAGKGQAKGSERAEEGQAKGNYRRREEDKKGRREEVKNPDAPPAPEIIPVGVTHRMWEAIKLWEKHRIEIKKKMTPTGREAFINRCIEWGEARTVAAVEFSMANGYQGCIEPNNQGNGNFTKRPEQLTHQEKLRMALEANAEHYRSHGPDAG